MTTTRWLALVAGVVLLVLLARRCTHDAPPAHDAAAAAADAPSPSIATRAPLPAASPAVADPDAATSDALAQAADLVQQYLQSAGAGRWADADALWRDGQAPDARSEGGLRALLPAAAFRIRSDTPEPLDKTSPPMRIRVPVDLRVTAADGRTYRYTGHYAVRRDAATRPWRIAGADVSAQLDGQ